MYELDGGSKTADQWFGGNRSTNRFVTFQSHSIPTFHLSHRANKTKLVQMQALFKIHLSFSFTSTSLL